MNYEGHYIAEGFIPNLFPCFKIVFVHLGVITKTKNDFAEMVAVSECYLIINSFLKK